MMEKCYDIGTIQAFLDGELSHDLTQKVTRHIALCDDCAASFAEAEEETAFAFSALEREFDTLVPTHRLWTKINDSIVEEKSHSSVWQRFLDSVSILLSNPSMTVAAGVLIVFGIFAVSLITQNDPADGTVASIENQAPSGIAAPFDSVNSHARNDVNDSFNSPGLTTASGDAPKVYAAAKRDDFRRNSSVRNLAVNAKHTRKIQPKVEDRRLAAETFEYLPGEESYLKTIASLSQTVENQKDSVLRPSMRVSFERDLAVVSDAIDKMKKEVRKNPRNESAKQVLYSSYQNKIDLLNSVAERNELMASLK
jgi:hypothetical protein